MFGGRKKSRHIVVSYASADRRAALALVTELEAHGVRIWVAPRDLDPTQGAAAQAHQAIRSAGALVMIVSEAANLSKVLKNEADIAVGHAPILPVRIEDAAPAQALRSLVQGQPIYDLFGDARAGELARLAEAALHHGEAPHRPNRIPARPAADAPTPTKWEAPEAPPSAKRIDADTVPAVTTPIAASGAQGESRPPLGHNAAVRYVVGPNANAIIEHWRVMDRRRSATRRFAAGLLFGRYWLAYRKLWVPMIASSSAAIALVALALWADGRGSVAAALVAIIGILALSVVVWLRGLALLRVAAERRIERWNTRRLSSEETAAALARHGGASRIVPVLLVAIEAVVCLGLALWLDPGLMASLTTPDPPIAAQKLDLVDMTRPLDDHSRYTFCIQNPTDLTISFTLRYASGSRQDQTIGPRSKAFSFWSRSLDAPSISFDHVLGDGSNYTDRSYGLNTARTEDQSSCGGVVYYFMTTGNDVDLKLRDQAGALVNAGAKP